MPLWSFPGKVVGIDGHHVLTRLDLGCKLYTDTPIKVAGLAAHRSNLDSLTDLLTPGTPVLAVCGELPGGPIRAHLTLADGRDVASTVRSRPAPRAMKPSYGGGLGKQWTYPATVVHSTDGDSFQAEIETGSPVRLHWGVRVAHVNAPEKATAEGQAAEVWAERILTPGLNVTITSHKYEKYGRLLGSVLLPDGHDYALELIAAGHAVPYEGGPR